MVHKHPALRGCVASSSVRGWSARSRGLFPCVLLGEGTTLRRKGGLRVKMCVWLGVSRGLDLAFLNAD